jgi:hypothetical protein
MELMIGLALTSLLLSALFLCFRQLQILAADLSQVVQTDQNLALYPILLNGWFAAAGNKSSAGAWEGVSLQHEGVTVRGDVDGDDGFPDGDIADSFETLSLRRSGDILQLKSGQGSFQPVMNNLAALSVSQESENLLQILIETTSEPVPTGNRFKPIRLQLKVHLWNYRRNLFEGAW